MFVPRSGSSKAYESRAIADMCLPDDMRPIVQFSTMIYFASQSQPFAKIEVLLASCLLALKKSC